MTPYQQFIAVSRYARWLPEEGRRETWEESVDRLIAFWDERFIDWGVWANNRDSVARAIRELQVMPSMRTLMTAGPALAKDNVAGFNPVALTTRVVTKEHGNVEIGSLVGNTASVLNKDGRWAHATFNSYGAQPASEVVLKLNSNTVKKVVATKNHRWYLTDGSIKSTDSLRAGDRIPFVCAPKATEDEDYVLGVRHGIVYGDGSATKSLGRVKGYMLRLCGDSRELLRFFNGYSHSYPLSCNGDPIVYLYDEFSATINLKALPLGETESYVLGFIRGWLAADGSVTTHSQVSLCCNEDGVDWLVNNAERAGFVVQRVQQQAEKTNYGNRTRKSFVVYFSRSSVNKEDMLCSWKAERLLPLNSHYVVSSVTDAGVVDVACAEVEDTNTFTLESGILTGNCAYRAVDDIRAFDEILYILMCGTGMGFSVERAAVDKLPNVADTLVDVNTTITVADSKMGWAGALKQLIALLYAGNVPSMDYSLIRPAGSPLKTFGGRASGPEPLIDLCLFTIATFKEAAGRKLTSLECHDIVCKIAQCVVVGGVRRSALISLSDLTDEWTRGAKSGQWWIANPQRALANNSAIYKTKPTASLFLKEWQSLIDSGSGERGLFNRVAAKAKFEEIGREWKDEYMVGTNPCLTGDTVIATIDGPRTFKTLADSGEDVKVYSWHPQLKVPVVRWMRRPHKTGENVATLRVEFDSGLVVNCTHNHGFFNFRGKKVKADELTVGMSVRAFSASRDSSGHERVHAWDSVANKAIHKWTHRMLWEEAVGQIPDGWNVAHLNGDAKDNRLENLQAMPELEHRRYDMPIRQANGMDGKCRNHKVVSISEGLVQDVYNGCVDDSHTYIILDPTPVAGHMSGIVSANCGEIMLRSAQFCNLTEVVARPDDTLESLKQKVYLATLLGTMQSTLTNFRYLSSKWKKNTEEERLLGVSITGIFDCPLFTLNPESVVELRKHAINCHHKMADNLGINRSVAVTTVKPSGTVSQLVDSASGIHPRHAPYYIRRVRCDIKDPVSSFLEQAGVPCEIDSYNASAKVFSFPMKAPEGRTRSDVGAIEHMEIWHNFQKNYTDHNPSVTITVDEHEWVAAASWVYDNFNSAGGLSFLPKEKHTYRQAPYETCTEEEYNKLLKAMPDIDWAKLAEFETQDATTGVQELACTGGSCDI